MISVTFFHFPSWLPPCIDGLQLLQLVPPTAYTLIDKRHRPVNAGGGLPIRLICKAQFIVKQELISIVCKAFTILVSMSEHKYKCKTKSTEWERDSTYAHKMWVTVREDCIVLSNIVSVERRSVCVCACMCDLEIKFSNVHFIDLVLDHLNSFCGSSVELLIALIRWFV